MRIDILDAVTAKVLEATQEEMKELISLLSFKAEYYKPARYGMEKKEYQKCMVGKATRIFYTGLVQRVFDHFTRIGGHVDIVGSVHWLASGSEPHLNGLTLRDFQEQLVNKALLAQRGVILSPTGSGKTVIAAAILSCFPERRFLFLTSRLDLIKQTEEEFKRFGLKDVQTFTGGNKRIGNITIATTQSLARMDPKKYNHLFDGVIIDEVHHVSSTSTQVAKILSVLPCPIRIGLTATLPLDNPEALFCIEGLVGPVIGEMTVEDGVERGYLAKPKITLIDVPMAVHVEKLRTYQDIYQKGIVESRMRNHLIAQAVAERADAGKSVLILVNKIEHGEILHEALLKKGVASAVFIQGATETDARALVKDALNKKHSRCVIATVIWREGVNIPSLDTVIPAGAGKSEIATVQAVGRGLRTTTEKETVEVIDFLDHGKYLAAHSINRLAVYVANGWL